jgi:predicted RNase H-like HicB family nuclease
MGRDCTKEGKNEMNYYAIVHHDPGSAYGASFPDLAGCFAAADDENDLLKNAICAVDDYLAEEAAAPAARTLEDIRAEYADDLKDGAYILSVPYIPRPAKSVRLNISLDRGLVGSIDEAAERLGLSRSAFLAQAAVKEIKQATAA